MGPEPQRVDNIDHCTNQQYWQRRSSVEDVTDPRTVTLSRVPGVLARLEVSLYQSWSLRAIDAVAPGRALAVDLGCGLGTWTVRLAERAKRVVAVDLTEMFVTATRKLTGDRGMGDRVEVSQADLTQYDVPVNADIILAGAVIQYFSDDEANALLARIRAALAPGGVFYLRTTVSRSETLVTRRDADYQGNYRPIAWYLSALAAAGFTIRTQETAMRFVPAELNRRWWLGWLVAPFWWLVRSRRNTDVCAFVCSAR